VWVICHFSLLIIQLFPGYTDQNDVLKKSLSGVVSGGQIRSVFISSRTNPFQFERRSICVEMMTFFSGQLHFSSLDDKKKLLLLAVD